MASIAKKEALAALDEANIKYRQVCSELKKKYAEIDNASDNAITLISNVENLIESIRHRPWSYKAIKKKIAVTKKKFVETKDLKRKERNKNITAGVVAGGAFVGGMTLLLFMKELCRKNIIKWIICLVLFVLVLVAFLVYKLFNGIMTAQKAYEQTKLVKEEIIKNRILFSEADVQKQKIEADANAVMEYYKSLKSCSDCNYKDLPEETKNALALLYNLTLGLTELINAQIG